MDHDDRQLGHILSRREVLALLGATGVTMLMGCGPSQSTAIPPTGTATGPSPTTQAAGAAAASAATVGATATATASAALSGAAPTAVVGVPTIARTAIATTAATVTAGTPVVAASAGATATAATTGAIAAVPSCIVRPQGTEGPYYVAEELNRADIRSDPGTGAVKAGAPLTLTFNVSQITTGGCAPLPGAKVEIWHCDAVGSYSDESDAGVSTKGQQFLRGYQVTDGQGRATFTTIYPGWYRGRAVHIHFKVHPDAGTVFTSQLFFDDALSDTVFALAPYAAKGKRDRLNRADSIYKELLLMTTVPAAQGYAAAFDLGIQQS